MVRLTKEELKIKEQYRDMTDEDVRVERRRLEYVEGKLKKDLEYLKSCVVRMAHIEHDLEFHTEVVKDLRAKRTKLGREFRLYSTKTDKKPKKGAETD